MSQSIEHFGWFVSPYSAKTRAYLNYIGQPFIDVHPTAWTIYRRVNRNVGRTIMPTVCLPDGTWLQDSSAIIDHFEALNIHQSVVPKSPMQRFASAVLEVFADEWLPMAALHYRWNRPKNARFARREFARSAFPWLPTALGSRLIRSMADKMQSYLPVLGVDEETQLAVEETARLVIAALDNRLTHSEFLLGGRPCLGDFSLYGPLWAHLYRDPASTLLFDAAPNVVRWMKTLTVGAQSNGPFDPEDTVDHSLDPVFDCALVDQWPWMQTVVSAIDDYCREHPQATRVPRALGHAGFTIRGRVGERKIATGVQWKAQRATRPYASNRATIDSWMDHLGERMMRTEPYPGMPTIKNPLVMRRFKPVLADRVD